MLEGWARLLPRGRKGTLLSRKGTPQSGKRAMLWSSKILARRSPTKNWSQRPGPLETPWSVDTLVELGG
jgi:hypothetical protein